MTSRRTYTTFMRIGRHLVWALLSLLAAGAPVAGHAQELIDRRQRHEPRIEPSSVSLDQAVEMAQRRYRAKAVKAETVQNGGKRVHQIRLLSAEGKVWTVRVDAESGAMH
ncbi:MAG TPA: PepSY domain-containing protein [Steroidobacteraceae bacterium]|nr:PepSY domain-containing protein [Steroidobacteraceae bacterium]